MVTRGFGTNFHKIYASDADVYHRFSAAEFFSKKLKARLQSLERGDVLLDLACGTCHKTDEASARFEKVYALDYSHELLRYAAQKYQKNQKLHFLWSSAANIPLLDETVDTILVTWGSFPLTKTLREMKRVLRSGGTILRIGAYKEDEFTTLFPKFSKERIRRINNIFKRNGFVLEEHEVEIRFPDLKSARHVLSKIVGAPANAIKKSSFKHTVVLCYYKKP